jgi:hypothetical protein
VAASWTIGSELNANSKRKTFRQATKSGLASEYKPTLVLDVVGLSVGFYHGGEAISSDCIGARNGALTPLTRLHLHGSCPKIATSLGCNAGRRRRTRLQSLTIKIAGDSRPKQFCAIVGGESLLAQTRARLKPLFHVDREIFVVTRAHETYYREELWDVDDSRIIPQPLNRGTGVAIAVALLQIMQRDPDAVGVFTPCDHYYSDSEAFGRAIQSAISGAEQFPESIVLLGAEAHYAEVEYGWIEPGPAISHASAPLLRVNRFFEKPFSPQSQALLRRGCLWNTFVTVGYARTFLEFGRLTGSGCDFFSQ